MTHVHSSDCGMVMYMCLSFAVSFNDSLRPQCALIFLLGRQECTVQQYSVATQLLFNVNTLANFELRTMLIFYTSFGYILCHLNYTLRSTLLRLKTGIHWCHLLQHVLEALPTGCYISICGVVSAHRHTHTRVHTNTHTHIHTCIHAHTIYNWCLQILLSNFPVCPALPMQDLMPGV